MILCDIDGAATSLETLLSVLQKNMAVVTMNHHHGLDM